MPRKRVKKSSKKKPAKRKAKRKESPSTNGSNGRNTKGQFAKGNKGGPGSPYVKKVAALRSKFFECVTPEDMEEVVLALLKKAKKGDVLAIKELLLRVLGQPQEFRQAEDQDYKEDWVGRLSVSDSRFVVVASDGDPIKAYNASVGLSRSEGSE